MKRAKIIIHAIASDNPDPEVHNPHSDEYDTIPDKLRDELVRMSFDLRRAFGLATSTLTPHDVRETNVIPEQYDQCNEQDPQCTNRKLAMMSSMSHVRVATIWQDMCNGFAPEQLMDKLSEEMVEEIGP
jgi:hypothetical protein